MKERQFVNFRDLILKTFCPICFNTNIFNKSNGEWVQGLRCCHLREVVIEDGKYVGHFSYQLGCFEGIKEAVK